MGNLRFALFGNVHQPRKSAFVQNLLYALDRHEAEVFIDKLFHDYLTQELHIDVLNANVLDTDNDDITADFAVSMGGDGTFLKTASRIGNKEIPIIGINTGRMGFLADVDSNHIDSIIDQIHKGEYKQEQHSVLEIKYNTGHPQGAPYALNEVAVLKLDNSSMISIRASVNGEYLTTYQADGLIVNTPTGSTGYALSVGGPIMSPDSGTIGIVPVAPHSLTIRPVSICDTAKIDLTIESRNHNFLVSIDGRSETCSETTKLTIQRAPFNIHVIKRQGSSFFSTLREKLMWGNDVRNGKL